jgi:hypothetical protein|tara:strand:- start:88 stop:573 length:486 start_codon:yes stop_codon:yes gene_type:complete
MENLDKALKDVGENVVSEIKRLAIKRDGFKASGDLEKSISYEVKGNIVTVEANRYIEALSEGIKNRGKGGKAEFDSKVANIKKWASTKGITPRNNKSGRFISADKMAVAIAFGIRNKGISKRFGYQGSGFLEEIKKDVVKNVTDMIAEAYKLDIIVKLKEI